MRLSIAAAAAAVCLISAPLLATQGWAASQQFHADLNTAQEGSSAQGNGHGTFLGTLDTNTGKLTYTLEYSDLTGPATAAHLHGPAPAGKNAPVAVPFTGDLSSPMHGTVTLDKKQMTELEDGQMYANVHTKQNPGGEIRGQVMKGK